MCATGEDVDNKSFHTGNVIFHFYIGGGVSPLTGPPNLYGFSTKFRGGWGKSILTNVKMKMFFFKVSLSVCGVDVGQSRGMVVNSKD